MRNEEAILEAIERNRKDDVIKICERCGRELEILKDDIARGEFDAIYCVDCEDELFEARLYRAYKEQLRVQDRYEEKYRELKKRLKSKEISVDEYLESIEELQDAEYDDILDCYSDV